MSASLFFAVGRGENPIDELAVDLAIERQRHDIRRQLRILLQGGLERLQHGAHIPGHIGSNPIPATNCGPIATKAALGFSRAANAVSSTECDGPPPSIYLCAWCRRPFNDIGQYLTLAPWQEPKVWSHGICPTCLLEQHQALEYCDAGVTQ